MWSSQVALFLGAASAVTINEINGNAFVSPYRGQTVANVSGIVTAKGPNGVWLRAPTMTESIGSDSIYLFSSTAGGNLTVGDQITLDATVAEYRSSADYLFLTELSSPQNVAIVSRGNAVDPVLVGSGSGLAPPTEQYSSLDGGDIFAVPNNQSLVSVVNPELQPDMYGMDFWENLSGELVTIESPVALGTPNSYDEVWVRGNWTATGLNARGGLTITDADANPEKIIIGEPLDGTTNPSTIKMGDTLDDITGVIHYAYGSYSLLPQTAITVLSSAEPALPPATTLTSTGNCSGLTFATYNVHNLSPTSPHLPAIASHIVHHLRLPDLLFLQEVQDDSGPTDDGTTSSNTTLSALIAAIASLSPTTTTYASTALNPTNNQDGGLPGANIRPAYLYNPARLALLNASRIAPDHPAWNASRKPLAALWRTADGAGRFWTANVHLASKSGSTPLAGDARPPVNAGVEQRSAQAGVVARWVGEVESAEPGVGVVVAGDWNEFGFVVGGGDGLRDLDEVVETAAAERYSYVYEGGAQALDRAAVSGGVVVGGWERVRVNSWAVGGEAASDHDPGVGRVGVCV